MEISPHFQSVPSPVLRQATLPAELALIPEATLSAASLALTPLPGGKAPAPLSLVEATSGHALYQRLQSLVSQRLQGHDSEWFSEEGTCMDFAALWLQDLRQQGIPASLALTDTKGPQGEITLSDGSSRRVDKFHAFVVIPTQGGELILDPTWKQFVADKSAAKHLPSILLGHLDEVQKVYTQIQPQLQLETHGQDSAPGQI